MYVQGVEAPWRLSGMENTLVVFVVFCVHKNLIEFGPKKPIGFLHFIFTTYGILDNMYRVYLGYQEFVTRMIRYPCVNQILQIIKYWFVLIPITYYDSWCSGFFRFFATDGVNKVDQNELNFDVIGLSMDAIITNSKLPET